MKKSYLAFIALTLWAVTSQAQFVQTSLNVDTVQHSGIHDVGWIRSHSFDNWYFGIEGGGHLYYGYEDRKGSFGDRLTGQTQIHLGHWIFPMFGFRGTIGFGNSHGFISKESYLANRGMLTADYGECWGPSTATLISGSDTIKGSLGGYYWPVDDNDNLFIQKWKYLYAGIDLMVNLTYLKPFNKVDLNRRLLNLVYLGFNVRAGISEGNPEKFSNFIGYSHDFGGFKNTNFAAEGHIGYICQYELSKHLNVFGSVQLSLLEGNFDRERLDGVEPLKPDLELAVMAGLSYDFHFRSEDRRRDYYVERNMIPYNAVTLPKFVKFIQQEDLDIIRYTEVRTITYYDTIIDSVSIRQMDTIIAEWLDTIAPPIRPDTIPDDEPLDSILLKRMLPYEMVFFDLDKWDIRPQEEMKIEKMARIMKAYPDRKFILFGSADAKTGTFKRNQFLSERRAQVVYNRLIVEYGINPKQLSMKYLGGILKYDPFILNRTTVIIMDHPAVMNAFEKMQQQRKAGGGVVEIND